MILFAFVCKETKKLKLCRCVKDRSGDICSCYQRRFAKERLHGLRLI